MFIFQALLLRLPSVLFVGRCFLPGVRRGSCHGVKKCASFPKLKTSSYTVLFHCPCRDAGMTGVTPLKDTDAVRGCNKKQSQFGTSIPFLSPGPQARHNVQCRGTLGIKANPDSVRVGAIHGQPSAGKNLTQGEFTSVTFHEWATQPRPLRQSRTDGVI